MTGSALIVGASGIVGNNLARHLLAKGWEVHGLARRPPLDLAGLKPVAADLLDPASLTTGLADVRPTHVFLTTWMRQPTEAENIRVNAAMVRNLLDALRPHKTVRHVALVTGLKHYLGPFEAYGKGVMPPTPFREEQPRLPIENFYYAQEDEVFAACGRDGFGWSVHRPHTIIGYALGNAMNMGVTLAAYASLCRETGPTVYLSWLCRAVERPDRYDRCAACSRVISTWASTTAGSAQPGLSTSSMVTCSAGTWMWGSDSPNSSALKPLAFPG